jgi:hypothetical protein
MSPAFYQYDRLSSVTIDITIHVKPSIERLREPAWLHCRSSRQVHTVSNR